MKTKRILAILLCALLMSNMLPINVLAIEGNEQDLLEEKVNTDEDVDVEAETEIDKEEEYPAFDQSKTIGSVTITVEADEGTFPEGAVLSVRQVEAYQTDTAISDLRDDDATVASSYTFDIKVIDPVTGEEYQPQNGQAVRVSFTMAEVANDKLTTNVYHIEDEGTAEKLDVSQNTDTAVVETDGFSLYTVEFTYNGLEYVLPGNTSISLDEILKTLGLSGEVTAAEISDESLFSVSEESGEWIVTAHKAFSTTEWMKVTLDGIDYEIKVTDDPIGIDLYTLTLNANCDDVSSQVMPNQTSGTVITLPAFDRSGYVFAGWAESATGEVKYKSGDKLTITGNLTLYAKWAKESCNINFEANGGTGTMETVTVTVGTSYSIPASGFYMDNYYFAGWAISSTGSIEYYAGNTVIITDDLTLYAVWDQSLIGGIPASSGGYVYIGGIRWRVIGESSDKMLLVSAGVLGGAMNWNDAKNYCDTVYNGFSNPEKRVVLDTTKTDTPYAAYVAADLSNAKLFLLSASEALTYFSSDADRQPGYWWLRSLRNAHDDIAGVVLGGGHLGDGHVSNDGLFGARPAFVLNLSSVLFSSAATGGKSSAAAGSGEFGSFSDGSGSDHKFTLPDSSRTGFVANVGGASSATVAPGGTLALSYSGAGTDTNEYVSAMICNSDGDILRYASLTPDASGSGTWNMTIPDSLAEGSYTLKVFSEQQNGNHLTDYASSPIEIGLTVSAATQETVATPTFTPAGGIYVEAQNVTLSCTTDGAEIYYTTDGSDPTTTSTKYTGAIAISSTATIKAMAVKSGMTDSAVASAIYTILSEASITGQSKPSGGDSGNDGNGGNSGNSNISNDYNNNSNAQSASVIPTVPVIPVIPINNDPEHVPQIPINTVPSRIIPDPGKPFIEGKTDNNGWELIKEGIQDAIRNKLTNPFSEDSVVIDMNGASVVPGDVLTEIKGQDVTVLFDLGEGVKWTINGMDITGDNIGDIDFGVKIGTNTIPVEVVNNVTGERHSIQISLAHNGDFGFTAILSVDMDKKNAGLFANLFYYNTDTGELEFICADEISEDGIADLTFTHASDYTIVIDTEPMDGSLAQTEVLANAAGADNTVVGSEKQNGATDNILEEHASDTDAWSPWWIIIICGVIIAIGLGGFYVIRKKL